MFSGSGQQNLVVWATGGPSNLSDAVVISKIEITKTANAPSFTLPATTTIQCGATSPVTFTVTTASNPNNLTITDYTWNFGANSGWLYNGSPASSPISTGTSNTITLTPICGTNQSSITATVTAGGSAYPTNSSSISYTVPSLSLDGSGAICSTGGQYQILGLPCSASVSWTSSNTSIATVPSSGNPVTVSRVGSATGSVVLTAVVSGLCGSANQTFTTTIAGEVLLSYLLFRQATGQVFQIRQALFMAPVALQAPTKA